MKREVIKRRIIFTLLFAACYSPFASSHFAIDVGVTLDQSAEYSGSGSNDTKHMVMYTERVKKWARTRRWLQTKQYH